MHFRSDDISPQFSIQGVQKQNDSFSCYELSVFCVTFSDMHNIHMHDNYSANAPLYTCKQIIYLSQVVS